MSVKIFDTMTTATPNFPLAYAEKINIVKEDGSEADIQTLYNSGELSGGDNSLILTESEFLALPEEEKLNNSYYLYDIGVHYKNGIAYSRKEPISLTMAEYKALEEVDPDQEYIVSADAEGILLGAEDIGYNNAESGIQATTVQGAIDKVAEKIDGLISDTNLTSTTSTLSANKIKNAVTYSFDTQSGSVKYVKFKPSITTVSVIDIYGGKIEILGASKASANPDYKTVKVVRLSYGDWSSYDATQVPSVVHTKIGELYYYPTDEYYYLKLYNYAAFTMTGLATAPEIITSLPTETSAMTLIPETDWGKIDDTSTNTTSTWSSSRIAQQINNATAIKYDNVINVNATKETDWSLAQGESHFYGRLLQLDGHLGSKSSTFSFLLFVKANYDNPTTVYVTQLAGMDDDRTNIAHTTYFELGVSSSGNLTIKNKSGVTASYRFI